MKGTQTQAYALFGAHPLQQDGQWGTRFAVWAPHATNVWIEGDFNQWCGNGFRMDRIADSGIWALFVPGVGAGALYKICDSARVRRDPRQSRPVRFCGRTAAEHRVQGGGRR